jgi:tRNA modification GTPase
LRETADVVERIGIEVSERYLRWANVVLACGDSDESLDVAVEALAKRTGAPIIRVRTKVDLSAETLVESASKDVRVSAETGEGLTNLIAEIDRHLDQTVGSIVTEMPILTRSRHIHGIRQAREEIAAFGTAWRENTLPAPVAAVHLRSAVNALESLIGAVSTEDVLDRVFSSFCVGK